MKPLQPLGCIDILVCNASILRIGKFLDLDDKDYQDNNECQHSRLHLC